MPDPLKALLTRGFRYAMALTGDRPRAEDLLQDAWESVVRAGGPHNAGYLYRAIRTRWIDHFRRGSPVLALAEVDRLPSRDDGMQRVEDRSALAPVLAVLRPDEREVLFLCVVEGYSASEAGEILGRPRNTVLSLLHRGRARIRSEIGSKEAL